MIARPAVMTLLVRILSDLMRDPIIAAALRPLLPKESKCPRSSPARPAKPIRKQIGRLVQETRENLSWGLPFTSGESQFLEALLERAEIVPEHLTDDASMIARIRDHPMLHWKAHNVTKFKNLQDNDPLV
jgi:hypothetical protein